MKHYKILSNELKGVHEKRVLELSTGSGGAVNFLSNDNQYAGADISPGLLRKAVKKFFKKLLELQPLMLFSFVAFLSRSETRFKVQSGALHSQKRSWEEYAKAMV